MYHGNGAPDNLVLANCTGTDTELSKLTIAWDAYTSNAQAKANAQHFG